MRNLSLLLTTCVGLCWSAGSAGAQTEGTAKLEVTLANYSVDGPDHWTAVWVTTGAGAFIKTLWKQGTSYGWTSSQWTTHMPIWNAARAGSTTVDVYSSATARDYSGTNSPIIVAWNGRGADGTVVPDGAYKFWVQYAEDSNGPGPYTTNGLSWTKGSAGATNTYPNKGGNFTNLKVTWTPTPPIVISALKMEGNQLVMGGTGPANTIYHVLVSADVSGANWTPVATNTFNSAGQFRFTNAVSAGSSAQFYRLKKP